jgi:hypothetical protein
MNLVKSKTQSCANEQSALCVMELCKLKRLFQDKGDNLFWSSLRLSTMGITFKRLNEHEHLT